ncbi:MAG: hypothetical protein DRO99_02620, partial [Candidatus Aenigmatarchaeota archaeon]
MLLLVLLLGTYELYYTAMVAMSGVRIGVKRYQEDIFAIDNSLDGAKSYLETSLRYSAYQACFDNLRNGGWEPGRTPAENMILYKGRQYARLAGIEQAVAALESATLGNLNKYASDRYIFASFSLPLPSYNAVNISQSGKNLTMTARAQRDLSIYRYVEKEAVGQSFMELKEQTRDDNILETIMIAKGAGLEQSVTIPCISLIRQANRSNQDIKAVVEPRLTAKAEHMLDEGNAENRSSPEGCTRMIWEAQNQTKTEIEQALSDRNIRVLDIDLGLSLKTPLASYPDGNFTCMFKKDSNP